MVASFRPVRLVLVGKTLPAAELDAVGAEDEDVAIWVLLQVLEDLLVAPQDNQPPSCLGLTISGAVLGPVRLNVRHLQGSLELRVATC